MAQSGWYDDPDGTVGRLRYFDGQQWTAATRPTPGQHPANTSGPLSPTPPSGPPTTQQHGGPTPAQPAPLQPTPATAPPAPAAPSPAPLAPAWGSPVNPGRPGGTPAPRRRRRPGLILGGIAAAVVLLSVASQLGGVLAGPTATGTTGGATSSTPRPSFSTSYPRVSNPPVSAPTLAPTGSGTPGPLLPSMPDCPLPTATTISDGSLTLTIPSEWATVDAAPPWASTCSATASAQVVAQWAMSATVGTVDDAVEDLSATADLVWQAGVTDQNGYPSELQPRATITGRESVTVQGLPGYRITGEVRVTGVSGIEGDVMNVLILRLRNGGQHAVVTVHTISDAAGAAAVDAIVASLKVTG